MIEEYEDKNKSKDSDNIEEKGEIIGKIEKEEKKK